MTRHALDAALERLGSTEADLFNRDYLLTWQQSDAAIRFVLEAADVLERLVHANRTGRSTKEVEHPAILAESTPPPIGLAFREFIRKPRRDEPVILRLEFKGKVHRSHAFLKQERIIDESLGNTQTVGHIRAVYI